MKCEACGNRLIKLRLDSKMTFFDLWRCRCDNCNNDNILAEYVSRCSRCNGVLDSHKFPYKKGDTHLKYECEDCNNIEYREYGDD